ncbi:MAG: hypothetical protein O3C57_06445 [Verrucomicrobia bacterium]|nr:hypothetical protein [Verrucomicrobiota bacterium]
MKPLGLKPRVVVLRAVAVAAATLVFGKVFQEAATGQALVDNAAYASLMAKKIWTLEDLITEYEIAQETFLPLILPRDPDAHLFYGGVLPYDTEAFPAAVAAMLLPEVLAGAVRVYPVTIFETREAYSPSRVRRVYNMEGVLIAELPVPPDYDRGWYVQMHSPELYATRGYAAAFDEKVNLFDGARIGVLYDLVPSEDAVKLAIRIQSPESLKHFLSEPDMMMKYSAWSGSVTNLKFVDILNTESGLEVTVGYPADFTNGIDIFTTDGGTALIDNW